jgi:AmmeMemoRadiSam system protein A
MVVESKDGTASPAVRFDLALIIDMPMPRPESAASALIARVRTGPTAGRTFGPWHVLDRRACSGSVEHSDQGMHTMPVMQTTAATARDPAQAQPADAGLPPPVALSPEAGAILLHLARIVVAATASGRLRSVDLPSLLPDDPPASLLAPAAAFVTLHRGETLCGCVGSVATDQALWVSVTSAAVSAASRDPRFLPIAEREVPSLTIDVSVLGPREPLGEPSAFRPGIDGVIVERGDRRGLLLPEVATDQGWGAREMLEATCWKAGLPEDAWRDEGTRLFVFRTARVSEAGARG